MNKLSPNFSREEFACGCGCGFNTVDIELIELAEVIREHIGAYSPSDACRCKEHNEIVQRKYNKNYAPYTSKSQHLIGRAMDVKTKDPQKLYTILDALYPHTYGLGVYSWGIHIDTRDYKARWGTV